MKEPTDDQLIDAMLGHDPGIAMIARRIFLERHREEFDQPAHCSECFEGCEKCQGKNNETR
jgi:hypothetical protein